MIEVPVPAHTLPRRTVHELLVMARRGLGDANGAPTVGLRYANAHLAALRAASAVVAARATPGFRPGRSIGVWVLLVMVAPELAEWAAFFTAGVAKRAAAEAGIPRVVNPAEADSAVLAAAQFIGIVESMLEVSR